MRRPSAKTLICGEPTEPKNFGFPISGLGLLSSALRCGELCLQTLEASLGIHLGEQSSEIHHACAVAE